MRSIFDIDKLAKLTKEVMSEMKIESLNGYYESPRKEESLWGRVCKAYFGRFDFSKSMAIHQKWMRCKGDDEDFASKIQKNWQSNHNGKIIYFFLYKSYSAFSTFCFTESQQNQSRLNNELSFDIDEKTWKELLNHTSVDKNGRKYFKAFISQFLSKKIQKLNLPCWLKEIFNWFSKTGKNNRLWSGKFKCCECETIFRFSIIKREETFMAKCDWNCSINHPVVCEKIRCAGESRNILKNEIMRKGTVNTSIDNIVLNNQNSLDDGKMNY